MSSDEVNTRAVHLRLSIRTTTRSNFRVSGDRPHEFRQLFATGRAAAAAIYEYCRAHHCTAFVQIYHPKAELWREDWVATDGSVRFRYSSRPPAATTGGTAQSGSSDPVKSAR